MHNAESKFSNFMIEYFGENKTESRLSGAQIDGFDSNHEKYL